MRKLCLAGAAASLALAGAAHAQESQAWDSGVISPDTNVGFPVNWKTLDFCTGAAAQQAPCPTSYYTSTYKLLWSDEFNTLSVAQAGSGVANWYTGVRTPFISGEKVAFAGDPVSYTVSNGVLSMKTRWSTVTPGAFVEASLTSFDNQGHGYLPANFYAEVRMKGPQDNNNHCGIWFTSIDNGSTGPTGGHAEVDMAEQYGPDDQYDHSSSHIWPGRTGGTHKWVSTLYVRPEGKAINWHTYGFLASPYHFVVYRDGQAVRVIDRQPQQMGGMFMLLSLFGNPNAGTPIPTTMQVDYVRVYTPQS